MRAELSRKCKQHVTFLAESFVGLGSQATEAFLHHNLRDSDLRTLDTENRCSLSRSSGRRSPVNHPLSQSPSRRREARKRISSLMMINGSKDLRALLSNLKKLSRAFGIATGMTIATTTVRASKVMPGIWRARWCTNLRKSARHRAMWRIVRAWCDRCRVLSKHMTHATTSLSGARV